MKVSVSTRCMGLFIEQLHHTTPVLGMVKVPELDLFLVALSVPGMAATSLTPEQLDEISLRVHKDSEQFIERLLYIRPKSGGKVIPFTLTPPQRDKLLKAVKEQLAAGKPVRIIILKARQLGFSTTIQGIKYWFCSQNEEMGALTIAHESKASKNLFQIFLRYHDNILPEFKPMVKSRNESLGILEFGNPDPNTRDQQPGLNSRVAIETAEDPNAGCSGTVQFVHASEVAFWTKPATFTAALQSVPDIGAEWDDKGNLVNPGSFIFLESTANGASGRFWEMWKAAEAGENEYIPIFVAWWEHAEYRRPVAASEQAAWEAYEAARAEGKEWDNSLLKFDEEEVKITELYDLDFGQIKWRRYAIYVNERGLKPPFLIKLDTHGFEVPILEGARETLKQTALVIAEAHNFPRRQSVGLRFYEFVGYMESVGFRCIDLCDPMHRPRDKALWQMDLVFAPQTDPVFQRLGYE